MPCIDYSSSGHHKGEWGDTGWLWVYAIRLAMAIGPTVIFSEMADHAMLVNGGETIKRILAALRVSYHVVMRIVKVWDYGDGSRRRRLIIVALRKDSMGACDYEMPAPVFTHANPHTARDTAVSDAEVPDDHWLKQPLIKLYNWAAPVAGELHRIGRVGMNMGPSWNPSLVFTFDGTNNGPTTFGGGGTKPPLQWQWGEPLPKRRLTTVVEYYSIASLSTTVMAFHDTFNTGNTPAERTHFLRDCVNQGWPAASAFKLALSIATHLLTVCKRQACCGASSHNCRDESSDCHEK